MTLQQLEYIVALDKHRHFVKAAESCHVTQSTLSMMIQKLEQELEINIFDRKMQPIAPTEIGRSLIDQAKVILYNAKQFKELALSEKQQESGKVTLGIIPTVAPYILPKLFNILQERNPNIQLHVKEITTAEIIKQLDKAEIDMALLATPLDNPNILEIPVYYERFFAYISPTEDLYQMKELEMNHIPMDHLWVLKEGHCLRNQVIRLCEFDSGFSSIYEAGSIDTLIKIVDTNGGYTIIPELHIDLLSEQQKLNVRPIVNPEPNREISLVVRNDYVKERLLNVIAKNISDVIPENMLNERLKKFSIKL
ncbi:MAG: LysR family transcriptional regulator [Lentimicrobiaceae bacterium]|nr:LysR family transcriptional regulator [Lentimicrobiaceae bacterium]